MRISGVGLAEIISLAMLHIFSLAPAISPPIEPVVSSTKHTSILGFCFLAAFLVSFLSSAKAGVRTIASERVVRIIFFIMVSNQINGNSIGGTSR